MGEKNFNEWVESNTMRLATNFKDEQDLLQTVKGAGHDAEPWGEMYKTHIDKELWFFWEKHEGKWQANFSKSDDMEKIKIFFRDLQRKANRQILYVEPQATKIAPKVEGTLTTIYTDKELLEETLLKFGAQKKLYRKDRTLICELSGFTLEFRQKEPGVPYELSFTGQKDARAVYDAMRQLDEGYRSAVQERTYMNVRKKLEEKKMTVESEEIMEDNSIVLTVNI